MTLPQPLLEFIERYVDSIETLDIMLLLQRAPDTMWRPPAIDSHFGMKEGTAEKRVQALLQNGLVTKGMSGGYRYAPTTDELRAGVAELASAYADRRAAVVNSVFHQNLKRLRTFADAFKVRTE